MNKLEIIIFYVTGNTSEGVWAKFSLTDILKNNNEGVRWRLSLAEETSLSLLQSSCRKRWTGSTCCHRPAHLSVCPSVRQRWHQEQKRCTTIRTLPLIFLSVRPRNLHPSSLWTDTHHLSVRRDVGWWRRAGECEGWGWRGRSWGRGCRSILRGASK